MQDNLKYYIEVIKPIEKKYNQMCTLYSLFHFKTFKHKRNFYNKIIINYYHMLLNNTEALKEILDYLKK